MHDRAIMVGVFITGVCFGFAVLLAIGFSSRSAGGTKSNPTESASLRPSTGTSLSFGSKRDNAILGVSNGEAMQGVNELQSMYRQALNEINAFGQGNPEMMSPPAAPPLTNPYASSASPPSYPVSPLRAFPLYDGAINQFAISAKPTDLIIPLTRQMWPGAN